MLVISRTLVVSVGVSRTAGDTREGTPRLSAVP